MNSTDKSAIEIVAREEGIQRKVTEYGYDKLQAGKEIVVTIVGLGKSAPGRIVSIVQALITKNESNPVMSYQFIVEGDSPWAESLSTSIVVPQKQMTIPVAVIQREGEKEFVYIYKAGRAKKTPIEAETNLDHEVAKNGLNWKDQMTASPGRELKGNQGIRVAANG